MVMRGTVSLVIFDQEGYILEKFTMGEGESISAVEMTPNTWHTVFPTSDSAVIFEAKEGPYAPAKPSDFASWPPKEGSDHVPTFQTWLENAKAGDLYRQVI